MKKLISILVIVALMATAASLATFAAEYPTPTDITADVKCTTAYDMYAEKLPIVRADAVFVPAIEYDVSLVAKAPGSGVRTITITDWADQKMESYFDDYFNLGDGDFFYEMVWANSNENDYDHGRLSYTFEVDEAGTYEFVFVGAAQVKAENIDNDSKDRGFAFQVDGGDIKQVNISDTLGTFQKYDYVYGKAELDATQVTTTNGVNSQYYQVAYYYGIQVELTAGQHTLDYYHLFFSGEHQFTSGNGPRLNYAGMYVQKYLTDAELAAYEYPEITTIETTPAPVVTTPTPVETTTPEPEADTTPAPEADTTPAPAAPVETTPAPVEEKGGCGASIGLGVLCALIPAALVIRKKRD